jgi:hypothetical protein
VILERHSVALDYLDQIVKRLDESVLKPSGLTIHLDPPLPLWMPELPAVAVYLGQNPGGRAEDFDQPRQGSERDRSRMAFRTEIRAAVPEGASSGLEVVDPIRLFTIGELAPRGNIVGALRGPVCAGVLDGWLAQGDVTVKQLALDWWMEFDFKRTDHSEA